MDTAYLIYKKKADRFSKAVSLFILVLIGILLFIPLFFVPNPPPEAPGILVSLGVPDVNPNPHPPAPTPPIEEEREKVEENLVEKPVEKSKAEKIIPKEPVKKVLTDESEKTIKRAEEEAAAKKIKEQKLKIERQKKIQAEKARKEAERQAEEKRIKEATIRQAEGLFGGDGTSTKPNLGDPNAEKLNQLVQNVGTVGGSLSGRGHGTPPKINDNISTEGRVIIKVCVNSNGNVESTDYKAKGSTTNDASLIALAKKNAKKWKFDPKNELEECGTITYEFKFK